MRYEPYDVVPRLNELLLPIDRLVEVLERAAGERANVNDSDPITTPGTEMWRWATRFIREDITLRELGWVACRHGQIDGIRHDELKMKLVVINTDAATGMPSKMPINCADKGPAAEKAIENNARWAQMSLFGEEVEEVDPISLYDFWYFCVHASEKHVSGEVSRPDSMVARTIRNFSERLIVAKPGDMPGLRRPEPVPEDFAAVEKPTIVRKG